MSENRIIVKKARPTSRGYVLQCHLKTTLTHLTPDKHSYTYFRDTMYQCNF